jgi:hypothetical protein
MAIDWVNSGSYRDLSDLLAPDPVTALAPTSQAGGNMMSSNRFAMTAPGSQPVDPLPPSADQGDPAVQASNTRPIPPATSGKPQASGQSGAPDPAPPAWAKTTVPAVIRET